jgi:hypothetical protein
MKVFRRMVSQVEQLTLDVPGEPGQRVAVRKLGHTALREAMAAKTQPVSDFVAKHGMSASRDEFKRQLDRRGGLAGVLAAGAADPTIAFDWPTLLGRSVLRWTPPRQAPPDPVTERWLVREILRFANPKLFGKADPK